MDDDLVKTLGDLAHRMNVSERTVQEWKKKGMPARQAGGWSVSATAAWKTATIRERPERQPESSSMQEVMLEQERLKRDNLLEKKREFIHKRKLRERNILPRHEYEEFLRDVITVTRDGIQALPVQLAKLGTTPQQQGAIYGETERVIRSALQQMSEMLERKGEAFE